MKQLLHLITSYIHDSRALITELKHLENPSRTKLFTANALAMYTKMYMDTSITAIRNLLATHRESIPVMFPTELFLTTLDIIIQNNIFTFGDDFWLQLRGAAMGTPAAPPVFNNTLWSTRKHIDIKHFSKQHHLL
jgi:hypothetical protein